MNNDLCKLSTNREYLPDRVHPNSVESYKEMDTRSRDDVVFAAYKQHGPLTDRQVRDIVFPGLDMNTVRPSITRLIDNGMLEESGACEDYESKIAVRLVQVGPNARLGKVPKYVAARLTDANARELARFARELGVPPRTLVHRFIKAGLKEMKEARRGQD